MNVPATQLIVESIESKPIPPQSSALQIDERVSKIAQQMIAAGWDGVDETKIKLTENGLNGYSTSFDLSDYPKIKEAAAAILLANQEDAEIKTMTRLFIANGWNGIDIDALATLAQAQGIRLNPRQIPLMQSKAVQIYKDERKVDITTAAYRKVQEAQANRQFDDINKTSSQIEKLQKNEIQRRIQLEGTQKIMKESLDVLVNALTAQLNVVKELLSIPSEKRISHKSLRCFKRNWSKLKRKNLRV